MDLNFVSLLGLAAVVIFLFWIFNSIYVIKEWERGVVLRLGRMLPEAKGAGLQLVLYPIDKLTRISLRIETLDVPPQDVITRDNVSVKVNAVCYFRVIDANMALSQVQNYLYATSQLAQTTLRSLVGQFELDSILSEREKVNSRLQQILDQDTEPWGIKVTKVEVKQVDIPENMQRAIARQAEAERERRAKIIHAEGEFEASSETGRSGGSFGKGAYRDSVAVSADADGDRRGEEHHGDLSAADRHDFAVDQAFRRKQVAHVWRRKTRKGRPGARKPAPNRSVSRHRPAVWRFLHAWICNRPQSIRWGGTRGGSARSERTDRP